MILHQNGPPFRLTGEIIRLSVADSWHDAKREWELEWVWIEPGGSCLCGHPITEHCRIVNRENGNRAVVGNCCVTKFLPGLPSGRIFAAVKRVMADPTKSLNDEAINHAHEQGWINDREREFYLDIIRPSVRWRGLSPKQRAWRDAINRKVLAQVAAGREASRA